MGTLEELFFIFGGAALGIAVGAIYFIRADRTASLALRLSTAAFAPSLAVILVVAGFLWPEQYRFDVAGTQAFLWLQAIPTILLLLSLAKYPGSNRVHLGLLPIALIAWLWTFALGWMAVHGK
ncbi:hypothetical protein IP87_20990 [beta proteobacterium AAP121]|nr:hypothetical protein IP87_20990 [beta proteobacterium AAP121]